MGIRGMIVTLALAGAAWADPLNGSFESPLSTGWTTGGNGTVEQLQATDLFPGGSGIAATDGNSFALVSNGAGDVDTDFVEDFGSLTSDTFTVDANGGTLSFDYQFLTGEFTGLDAFAFDWFEIWLLPTVGAGTLLATDDVSNTNFSLLADVYSTPAGVTFDQAQSLVSFSTAIAAGSYQLQFSVFDEFDGAFDSALFVDNVSLVNNPTTGPGPDPVPEPGTLVLLGAAGIAALARRRRR